MTQYLNYQEKIGIRFDAKAVLTQNKYINLALIAKNTPIKLYKNPNTSAGVIS